MSCQQFDFRKVQFSFSAEPFSGICMFAWFTADSGTFDCQAQFSVKTSLSEFSKLVIRNQVMTSV